MAENKAERSCEIDHTEESDMSTNRGDPDIWTYIYWHCQANSWVTEKVERRTTCFMIGSTVQPGSYSTTIIHTLVAYKIL